MVQSSAQSVLDAFEAWWGGAGGLQGYSPLWRHSPVKRGDETYRFPRKNEAVMLESFKKIANIFQRERDEYLLETLRGPLEELDGVLKPLNRAVVVLKYLHSKREDLSAAKGKLLQCSSGLQQALKHLLQQQAHSEALISTLQQRLTYYTQLEPLKQQLQHPPVALGPGLGSRTALEVEAMTRAVNLIDEAIQFFSAHPDYRDADANLCNYDSLRTRALSLILSAAMQHMRHTEDLLVEQLSRNQKADEKASDPSKSFAEGELDLSCLHVQCEVCLKPVRTVMELLYNKHEQGISDAYARALEQLEAVYVAMRIRLLIEPFKQRLQGLMYSSASLPAATRSVCSSTFSLCELEGRLFRAFSPSHSYQETLRALFDAIAAVAYDALCPAVLACSSVEQLCEIRQTLMVEVLSGREASAYSGAFLAKIYQLVTDVQERLFFRTEVFVETHISGFQPSPAQLNRESLPSDDLVSVPQSLLLVMLLQQAHAPEAHQRASGEAATANDGQDLFSDSTSNNHGINSDMDAQNPFNELCSGVIAACLSAVQKGAEIISSRKISLFDCEDDNGALGESQGLISKTGDIEAPWPAWWDWPEKDKIPVGFALRDVLSSFKWHFIRSERQLSFPSVSGTFLRLLRFGRGESGSDASLEGGGGLFDWLMPRVSEVSFDATKAVTAAIKTACSSFVASATALMCLEADRLLVEVANIREEISGVESEVVLQKIGESVFQRDLNTFCKKPIYFIPSLVQKMLPALAPEIFSCDRGALWQDGSDTTVVKLNTDAEWMPSTDDALSFIDFLLKPVLRGFFTKLSEVQHLLVEDLLLSEDALERLGWSGNMHERLTEEINKKICCAVEEALFVTYQKPVNTAAALSPVLSLLE